MDAIVSKDKDYFIQVIVIKVGLSPEYLQDHRSLI